MACKTARRLRKNQTEAEQRLWLALRDRRLAGFKFRRQRPIGPSVVDFTSIRHRLVIEVDGSPHADNEADARRTAWRALRLACDPRMEQRGVAQSCGRSRAHFECVAVPANPHPPIAAAMGPSLSRKR